MPVRSDRLIPQRVVGIVDRRARQLRELRPGALRLVAHDDDDRIEAGAARATDHSLQQRLAVELEEQLVASHAGRATGGEHDTGHRAAPFRRLRRHG